MNFCAPPISRSFSQAELHADQVRPREAASDVPPTTAPAACRPSSSWGLSDRHEVFRSVLGGLLRGRSRPKEKQQDEAAHVERRALLKAEAHETEDQPKQSQGLA